MALVSLLDLDETARIAMVDFYSFNVVWIRFEDCRNQCAEVCLDLRIGSPTRNQLFDKARHPTKPGATLLELGSEEEGRVILMLSQWLDSDEAKSMGYNEISTKFIRAAFSQLGIPITHSAVEPREWFDEVN